MKATCLWLRAKGSLKSLRKQLAGLKEVNAAAAAQLEERRRLAALLYRHRREQQEQRATGATSSAFSGDDGTAAAAAAEAERTLRADALSLLPENKELETAIAFTLRENRDARTELEFTRQLLGSTLLSLASPVGPWDPYDVKPQVFALDNYLALPVFTSLEYLTVFCQRFGFTTRDPSGVLWADGRHGSEDAQAARLMPPEEVAQSMWWSKESRVQEERKASTTTTTTTAAAASGAQGDTDVSAAPVDRDHPSPVSEPTSSLEMDAAALFDDLEDNSPLIADASPATATTKDTKKRLRRPKKQKRKALCKKKGIPKRKANAAPSSRAGSSRATVKDTAAQAAETAAKRAFWQSVADVTPFHLKQATPLPTFGPLVYPFFIGYFADINTLLHNAAIVPEKVDIVLNPTSPIEFVLAREATDRVLHNDQLLLLAYQRVERELQREFGAFFREYCPEVLYAKSACVPRPLERQAAERALHASREFSEGANPLQDQRARTQLLREATYTGGVAYDIAIVMRSEDLPATYRCLQWGKEKCLLMGHADLDVLPEEAAAPFVVEAAQTFYKAADTRTASAGNSAAASADKYDRRVRQRQGGGHTGDRTDNAENASPHGEDTMALLGMFRKAGESQTINVAQPADSYFHDPTNAYTEAHAVFTEELKIKGNQQ